MTLTVRLYAERKQWPVEGVTVRATRQPDHGKPDIIELEMLIKGALDAEQHERLVQISTRCPVHRSLMEGVKVVHRGEGTR